MKVIFLDMDGVLNSAWMTDRMRYIEKEKYLLLKKIVTETGAKVVLSTSWREFPDWKNFLTDFFACWDIEVIGATPILETNRSEEIKAWLKDQDSVQSFVILDDFDMRDAFPNNMVYTVDRGRIGLDEQFAQEAINILNKE